jgi:glyoxylase-like metal-dependent hydrolase (beta-lactamase superfamily II)
VLVLPPQQRVSFAFTVIGDAEGIRVGQANLTAIHTPGHTDESASYVLDETAVFTGDTLFADGVGRPDLHANPEKARQRARALFASLNRLRQLPEQMIVLPAHASEPVAFDGRVVGACVKDIGGWLSRWLESESAFVDRVTSNLPAAPPNFARIVELNEAGEFPATDPTDLEAGANRCAVR